jgi:hypothetical protein
LENKWSGYNFGAVVDFTYQAYDQAEMAFPGVWGFSLNKPEDAFEPLNISLANTDSCSGAMCFLAMAPDGSGPIIIVICFYNGGREEG